MTTVISARRARTFVPLALLASFALSSGCTRDAAERGSNEPVIQTSYGALRGVSENDIYVFRGIQYGASTEGKRRFKAPLAPESWAGVRDAQRDARYCPQDPVSLDSLQSVGYRPNARVSANEVSEDCLYLRVMTGTLDREAKRPVMVWLHGGGFAFGAGTYPVTDGTHLVKAGDVVQVAINHRVNIFGHLELEHLLGKEYANSGNAGLLDIVLALQWVKDNIEQFGGDPDNVTLFGQSGGGAKITALMAMPAAQDLYHKVIIQSGSAYAQQRTLEEAHLDTEQVMTHFNLQPDQAAWLLATPTEELRTAFTKMAVNLRPVVNGDSLPSHPWFPDAPTISAKIPMIIGVTQTEGSKFAHAGDFELTEQSMKERLELQLGEHVDDVVASYRELYPQWSPTDLYLLIHADVRDVRWMMHQTNTRLAQKGAPVYLYQFQWHTPVENGKWRSPHGVDIPFAFNTLKASPSMVGEPTPASQALADLITQQWIAFAHHGDPNAETLPRWDAYTNETRSIMLFNEQSEQVPGYFDRRLEILKNVPRIEPTAATLLARQRDAAK